MGNEKSLELGFATIDMDRTSRTGMQEVIYCGHKTAEQITGIVRAMLDKACESIILTRLCEESASIVAQELGLVVYSENKADAVDASGVESNSSHSLYYDSSAHIGVVDWKHDSKGVGNITIIAAGTSDRPVVEEAAITAQVLGNNVVRINDVGVAGIHRLLAKEDALQQARVIIVVAGMEGALASVVGGLVKCPVIAVPTSVGYGASFGGVSALLSMLNSCASGVSVVNIDNGFGAAVSASRINQMKTAVE